MLRNRFVQLLCGVLALVLAASLTSEAQRTRAAVAIPADSEVQVRLIDHLSSANAKAGQTFQASLEQPITSNGQVLYPKGAAVTGRVVEARDSGRLTRPGVLVLTLAEVRDGRRVSQLDVEPWRIEGQSHAKGNVIKIGGGAAAGAVIGGIAGGGRGAAIGAAIGAAAGTGVAAATGKKEAEVESEAVLVWNTRAAAAQPQQTAAAQQTTQQQTATAAPRAGSSLQPAAGFDGKPQSQAVESYDDPAMSAAAREFSRRDRQSIRSCFVENRSNLPPGLAKRDRLPPGLERQVRKNGTLPPGLQKRVQPMPEACSARLPQLPSTIERVILGRRVLLVDAGKTILDLFSLDGRD